MLENLFLPLFIAVISAFIATQVGESLRKLFIFIVVIVVLYMAYSFISSDPVEFSNMKFSPESISKISRTDQSDGTKYENEYKNTIYKNQLSEFEEKNDNKGALQYMNSNDLSDNPQYFEQYSVFSQRYVDEVTQKAEKLLQDGNTNERDLLLNEALSILPDNDTLLALYSERPESLFLMQEHIGNIKKIVYDNDGTTDNVGINRPYMIYCSSYLAHIYGYEEVTYKLNNQYSRLEFTLALSSASNDTPYNAWLEFRNGDTLIQSTDYFTAGSEPKSYSIPLVNVDELVITVRCDASSYSIDAVDLLSSDFLLIR